MPDMVDFSNEQEVEVSKTKAENTNSSNDDFSSDDASFEIDNIDSKNDDGVDLDGSAFVLFEDDDNIFTSEGVISKSSVNKDNSSDAEPDNKDEKILGKFDSYEDLTKSYKELEKKLGENSDAVNKLRELNPVLPMLEAMLGDETFLEMAEGYFTNPQAQSEAFKKQLGIDDDFVFDLNNALSDPKSEDAKILNKVMQARQPKVNSDQQQQQQQVDTVAKDAVMKKYNLSEDDFNGMLEKAQSYTITYDDIYLLLNKDKVITDAQKKAQEAIKKQVNVAQTVRKSRSGSGETPQRTAEDSFMAALSGGKGLFE